MQKVFKFGKAKSSGKHIPATFDETNLSIDFLTDFLFEGNAVASPKHSGEVVGFIDLGGDEPYACHLNCSCISNFVRYTFMGFNYLEQRDIDKICERIEEYFKDDENLEVYFVYTKLASFHHNRYATDPCLFFYRAEE